MNQRLFIYCKRIVKTCDTIHAYLKILKSNANILVAKAFKNLIGSPKIQVKIAFKKYDQDWSIIKSTITAASCSIGSNTVDEMLELIEVWTKCLRVTRFAFLFIKIDIISFFECALTRVMALQDKYLNSCIKWNHIIDLVDLVSQKYIRYPIQREHLLTECFNKYADYLRVDTISPVFNNVYTIDPPFLLTKEALNIIQNYNERSIS